MKSPWQLSALVLLSFGRGSQSFHQQLTRGRALPSRSLLRERAWVHESEEDAPGMEVEARPQNIVGGGVGEASARLGKSKATVWSEFARLAQENKVVNLGQGFPDWLPPKFAVDSLVEAALDSAQSPHQYTRPGGHPALVKQLARRYSTHLRREIDPMAEVAVTVGASQALFMTLQTLVGPGDEVILFEPFFDLYVNQVKLAGGTPVFVPLRFVPYDESGETITGGEWVLDPHVLNKAVNQKTKAIVLNSPHNPTGKIFTRDEMEHVAEALEMANPDCVVLSDEVYKYIVHSPPKKRASEESLHCRGHVHFASLPGMWDRTITISSAGKTFSATGWQVGWCIGPRHLIARIHQLLPYVQFCASTVIQEALARSLPRADEPYEEYDSYYDYLREEYTKKRDLLATGLRDAGFAVPDYDETPGGGFFIFARIGEKVRRKIPASRINAPNPAAPSGVARQDWALCEWMAEEKGVLLLPSAPFFSEERVAAGASEEFVRVAFCKSDETLRAAAAALATVAGESVSKEEVTPEDSSQPIFQEQKRDTL
jgi:kynurenine--oxoglutarate transaminase/cysteine-S-conjugate beta-lyase/glutamine--phenylpyruvate transaminase